MIRQLQGRLGQVGPLRFARLDNLLFLGNFSAAKLAVYLVPIGLAALASERVYGQVEFALAIGVQCAALLLGAPLAGVTQFFLVKKASGFEAGLGFLTFAGSAAALLSALTLLLAGASWGWVLVAASFATAVVQNTFATWARMMGHRNLIAWADGMSLLLTGLVILLVVFAGAYDLIRTAAILFMWLAGITSAAGALIMFLHDRTSLYDRLRQATRLGFSVMIAGLFATWLGVGGRILVGTLNESAVATYAIAFRIAGLALGMHQLANAAAFRRIYAARVREGDALISKFMIANLVVCVAVGVVGPFVPTIVTFAALDPAALPNYQRIVPILSLHIYCWIGFALLQSRINRYEIAGRLIMPMAAITIIGSGAIAAIAGFISADIKLLSWLIAIQAAAYLGAAFWLLARKRVPHRRTGIVTSVGVGVLTTVAAIATFA